MAIGFMSFGGMLTGGDEKPKEEQQQTVMPKEEHSTLPSKDNKDSDKKLEEKVLANNLKVNE